MSAIDDLIKKRNEQQGQVSTPAPVQPQAPAITGPAPVVNNNMSNSTPMSATKGPGFFDDPEPIGLFGNAISPEEQTQKFGGPVGSPEYYKTKAEESTISRVPRALSESFGLQLPNPEVWDTMNTANKLATINTSAGYALGKMVTTLPKAVVRSTLGVGLTALKPFYNMFTGKGFSATDLEKEEKVSLPWVGDIPTLYQTKADAEKSGMGPGAANLFAGSSFILDTASLLPVKEALVNTFRPKGNTSVPGVIKNTEPIKFAMDTDGVFKPKANSTAEYYSLPKTDAKQFGGNSNNVQWKFSKSGASGENSTISVVKQVKGKNAGDYVKTEFGLKKVEEGDFGPEIKVFSTEIKNKQPFSTVGQEIVDPNKPIFILPKERMGLSNRPVTSDQIGTLNSVIKAKGIDDGTAEAVIKTLTGKDTIGELTEKEFTRVGISLSKFGEKYVGRDALKDPLSVGPVTTARSWISPQRHVFDIAEKDFGLPLKSRVYEPMERAAQMTKVLDDSMQPELSDIFGKYTNSKYVEERRLIDAYVRGDRSAIDSNTLISSEVKNELKQIGDSLIKWDDTHGELLGVGKDAYLQNYGGPKIANLDGVFPQYKDLATTPSKEFFAKFKREGSLAPYIDDPLASRQIYIKEGTKAMHFGPVLEDFSKMYKELSSISPFWAKQANSYVQEKIGRMGAAEKFIDSFIPSLNKKLGINLPTDASRQAVNYGLSSMYSGLVATPKAVFQQTFQLPLFVYSRLGTKYAGEAFTKSFVKAERDRIMKGGWLNDVSLPYGAELVKDFSPAGKVGNAFKYTTQKLLRPLTIVDNDIRIKTFLQAEMQWNDALNAYNSGKIRWSELESKIDLNAFSVNDRNLIRQNLNAGNNDLAFNTYMREILDETSFPYRRGSGVRAGYGLLGKLGTGLLNYTAESTNVLGRWVATKQWDKVIRFAGNAGILNDTLNETFGVDFSNTIYQKPLGVISPAFGAAADMYDLIKSKFIDKNRKNMNEAKANLISTLSKSLPAGVMVANAKNFWKSINAGERNGKYPIYDKNGKLIDERDFTDLFWGTLIGFPTVAKTEESNAYSNILNRQTQISEIKAELDQLLREGKYDEMQKLMEKTGVTPSEKAMNASYIPRLERAYQSSNQQIKSEFAPIVYPEAFKQ